MDLIPEELQAYADEAWKLRTSDEYKGWLRRLLAFTDSALGEHFSRPIAELGGDAVTIKWQEYRDKQAAHIRGQVIRLGRSLEDEFSASPTVVVAASPKPPSQHDVFLVHGHDESAKESVARFLEKLGLTVMILHEQVNGGRTIIEKFESHADVGFAVVLLTPDDLGAAAAQSSALKGRARQNVILELGYFTGRLGRRRVCGLFRPGVELPSDLHGVLFIPLDDQGGWKPKLAQELVGAGMQIDLQGLLRG